ncbi:MAG: hypothetical protein ACPG4Z_01235 [Chitinophagales bacterium]
MKRWLKSDWTLLLFFWCITVAIYTITKDAKFTFDWNTWILHYSETPFHYAFTKDNLFGIHPIYHVVFRTLWLVWGFNTWGWMLSFTFIHALNGFLIFKLFNKLCDLFGVNLKHLIFRYLPSLLFIVYPLQTEVLVWGACINYLICTLFILSISIGFLKLIENQKINISLSIGLIILHLLSVYTWEIGILLPIGLFCILISYAFHTAISYKKILKYVWAVILPMCLVSISFFVVTKITKGNWAGHYGEASHFNVDLLHLIGNFYKYLLKITLISPTINVAYRDKIYMILEHWAIIPISVTMLIAILVLFFKDKKYIQNRPFVFSTMALFVLSLAPVISIHFDYLPKIAQDRYVYLPLVFFSMLLTWLLTKIKWKWLQIPVVFCFGSIMLYNLVININSWRKVGAMHSRIIYDYEFDTVEGKIYTLNTPDNISGAAFMRSNKVSTLAENVELHRGIDIWDRTDEILQVNVAHQHDDFLTKWIGDDILEIESAGGTWFWYDGFGASDRSTEFYDIEIISPGNIARITFKQLQDNDVIIYQKAGYWYEVEF